LVKLLRQGLSQIFGLIRAFDEERKRFVARAGLDFVNPFDGSKIQGIGCQAVKRVGGHSQDLTSSDLFSRIADEGRFGILRIDLYDFGANQGTLPVND
jgi:hypothetical protein